MVRGKKIRSKGKIRFSDYFSSIKDGSRVAVTFEKSEATNVPSRFQGRSGIVVGTRGAYKVIELNDGKMVKTFIIHPVHLRVL